MEIISLPNGKEAVVARYRDQPIERYRGNPLIEALPDIMSPKEVVEKISHYPTFHSDERLLDTHYRIHLLQGLNEYFQPLPQHLQLESAISMLIRNGYLGRNPFSSQYSKQFSNGREDIKKGYFQQPLQESTANSMTIIGISGIGKTSSLNKILRLMPSIICHSNYRGKPFNLYQIPYLRIQSSFDGSIKSLALNILTEIDNLIGSNYFEKYGKRGRLSTSVLLPIVAQKLRSLSVGILVCDEIQHLNLAKSGGAEQVLNFFTTLVNNANLPIIMVGTPKSLTFLQKEFRQARRGVGGGYGGFVWDRLSKDQSWQLFITGLWKYQWTKQEVLLTEELSDILYYETQGIPSVVLTIYIMSQIRAITTGKEKLTATLFKQMAKEMKLIKPMLDALKSGRNSQLLDYQDIIIPNIDGFIEKEKQRVEIKSIFQENQSSIEDRKSNISKLTENALLRLKILGIGEKEAKYFINQILIEDPEIKNSETLVKKVYISSLTPKAEKNTVLMERDSNNDDLRIVVERGKENGLTAYESLLHYGYIKNDYGQEKVG